MPTVPIASARPSWLIRRAGLPGRTWLTRCSWLTCSMMCLLAAVRVAAHQVPLETQAYIKVDGAALRVFVRLPMSVALADARLPKNPASLFELETIRPNLEAAAADLVKSLDIEDAVDNRPLAVPSVAWVVSPARDTTFATYQSAIVRLAVTSLAADAPISPSEGFLDVRLDYALTSTAPRLSVRVNGFRSNGQFVPTRLTYITPAGDERLFRIEGSPRRVFFEPSAIDAATMFVRLGVERLLEARELSLLLLCLAIPLWPATTHVRVAGSLFASILAAAAVTSFLPPPAGTFVLRFCQLAASTLLGLAAIQSMTTTRVGWVRAVGLAFGMAWGIGTGMALHEAVPFAGSHAAIGLVLYLGAITLGAGVLLAIFRAFVAGVRRLPLPRPAVPMLLALVPLHTALHAAQDNGRLLLDTTATTGGGFLALAITYWFPVVAAMLLALLAIVALVSTSSTSPVVQGFSPADKFKEGR